MHFFRRCHAGGSSSAFLFSLESPLSGLGRYPDHVQISVDCPLSAVNRDSKVIHVRQVLDCAAPGKRLATASWTQGPIPGPPLDGIRCNVRSFEEEVPRTSIMKGLSKVGQSRGWCPAGPSGTTALGTPCNDAAEKLSYP